MQENKSGCLFLNTVYKHTSFAYWMVWYGNIPTGIECKGYETKTPAVAEKPRDASCHWIFRDVIQDQSNWNVEKDP